MFFVPNTYYRSLADKAVEGDTDSTAKLLTLAKYDERAVRALCSHKPLIPSLVKSLEDFDATAAHKLRIIEFFRKAVFYDVEAGDYLVVSFQRICSVFSLAESVPLKAAAAELIINIGRVQPYRAYLYNFSESYRHLLITRDPFHERAVCGNLAYIFCDDYLGDAVQKLQYKTDILNYINKLFLQSFDFGAWRYSVRCMCIAGNYNEDKADVDNTRDLVFLMNRFVPQFLLYFIPTFFYARYRHTLKGDLARHTPRYVVRWRSLFGALCCAMLGVYSGTYHEYRMDALRERFAEERQREMRKRFGFKNAGKAYKERTEFDSIDKVTQSLFWKQTRMYCFTAAMLMASQYPLSVWKRPEFMRYADKYWEILPVLLPRLMGVPAPFRRVVPFIIVPFVTVKTFEWGVLSTATWHDYFVRWRYWQTIKDL